MRDKSTWELAKLAGFKITNLHKRKGLYHVILNGELMLATDARRKCISNIKHAA